MELFTSFHFSCALQIHRNTIDFCVLTLYLATLQNSVISSDSFLHIPLDFLFFGGGRVSIYKIVSSVKMYTFNTNSIKIPELSVPGINSSLLGL